MATIVTRSGKGSPLTNNEVDANFTNLNTELGTKANTSSLATVATSGAYSDLTGKPTNVSSFSNDSGYITGITSSNVTTALGFTPYNATNPAGYITGITSGNVTTALGYTPANKAGDTFTGAVTINSGATSQSLTLNATADTFLNFRINSADSAYVMSSAGAMYVWNRQNTAMLFGTNNVERLRIAAGGTVTANVDIRAPIFYDSDNTTYYVDPAGGSRLSAVYVTGGDVDPSNIGAGVGIGNIYEPTTSFAAYGVAFGASAGQHGAIVYGSNIMYFGTENGSDNTMMTKATLNSSGTFTANGDVRAPIFYDADNTAYYMDLTGSTSINAGGSILASGNITLNNGANRRVRIGSATNYSYDLQTTGDDFQIIEAGVTPRLTIKYPNGNLGLNTTTPVGRLSVVSGSSTGAITSAWSSNYSVFGPNAGSTTGAAAALGYNSATDAAEILALAPSVAWKPLNIYSAGLNLFASSGGIGASLNGSGTFSAVTDVRAPIFYDSADTAFYADLAATSRMNTIQMGNVLNIGGVMGDGTVAGTNFHGIEFHVEGNRDYYIGKPAGGWTQPLNIYFYTGISHYAHQTFGGHRFWNINDGQQRFSIADGGDLVRSYANFHAPILYDINDTAFYADPNGTSVLNGLHVGTSSPVFTSSSFQYHYHLSPHIAYVKKSGGYSWYWRRNDTGLANGANEVEDMSLTEDGNLFARSSVRAPIFYDSNNTNYYTDPASTSNLNNLTLNTGPVYRSDWTTRFQSGSDFVDGTLVTTDIPATGFAGDSFVIEITGKTYDQNNPPVKVVAQGYLYADTIINYSGISYAGNFASYIKVFEEGGVLKFWWPRISYWNSFNVNVMGMDGPSNNTITRNRVTAISNSTEPTGTKKQQINLSRFMRGDVSATNSVDVRAPIFYDSNNTGYYLDPASTGTSLITAGGVYAAGQVRAAGWWGEASASATGLAVEIGESGGRCYITAYSRDAAAYGPMSIEASDFTFTGVSGGFVGVNTSVRAPIFYDSENTARFVDPSSTSVLNVIRGTTLQHSSGQVAVRLNGDTWTEFCDPNGATKLWLGGGDPNNYYNANVHFFRNNGAGNTMTIDASGIVIATADMRAPIFYDNNDTGYYLDPNTTGLSLRVNGNMECYARSAAWSEGYRVRVPSRATWGGIRFTRDDGNSNGNWAIGFTGIDSTDDLTFWGNLNGGEGMRARLTQGGIFSVAGDVRAPVYYDSNNTGFYIDPATGSYLSGATFTDLITGRNSPSTDVNTANDTGSISIRGSTTTVAAMSFHRAGAYAINMGLGTDNVFRIGGWSAQSNCLQVFGSGVVQALNDFRAPIFYDSNDTARYLDPTSVSSLAGAVLIGPNSSGKYTRIGGNGGATDMSTVSTSNGNLHLDAESGSNIYLAWYNTSTINVGGSLSANGNITAYSDIRVKANVETIPSTLDKLDQIRGVTYTRTDLEDKERRYAGVIAQDIEAVLPEAVFESDGRKSVDYNAIIGLLIQAVKELRDEVEMLRK